MGLVLIIGAAIASAQEAATEDVNISEAVESPAEMSESTDQVAPAQLFALAQNVDDNELLRMYKKATPEQIKAKAKKVRITGSVIGGIFVVAGIVMVCQWSNDDACWTYISGGVIAAGAAVAVGCNLYANSLQKKAYSMQTYTAPIMEGEIMNIGSNKLTAGVSVMGNQYTHTRGLGMSVKLNF